MSRGGRFAWVLAIGAVLAAGDAARAQMVTGLGIPGSAETMGLGPGREAEDYTAQFIGSTVPGNVLWPGEQGSFTFQLVNSTDRPIRTRGRVDVIQYGTKGRPDDIWVPDMFKLAEAQPVPVEVDLAPRGFQNITVEPRVPDVFGAWALVVDLGASGRRFVTSFVRTFRASPKPVQFPQFCLDVDYIPVLTRLGASPNRMGIDFKPTTDKDFDQWYRAKSAYLKALKEAGLSITLEFGAGAFFHECQPLGRPRPWLDADGVMLDTKSDICWMPSWDGEFRKLVKLFVTEFGWPKGPVNGVKIWNEPWNGISISGWGADDMRYRELHRVMGEAVDEARREAGVQVLIGGCDSSSNTFDKLFADGSDEFLKWLDFCSIHYQGMFPPSTVKAWVDRKHPNGRVRIWDTESWVANSDDRVAAVVATNLSTGHDRAVGVYHGNIATEEHSRHREVFVEGGKKQRIEVCHTWSVAAAVGAVSHFIGERRFKELLFKNGLPWVMVFDGLAGPDGAPDPEDGTVVVVGDIGEEFGHDNVLFRSVRSLAELARKDELRRRLEALPPGAAEERAKLREQIDACETRSGARMILAARGGRFALFDFYGNPVPARGGRIEVPLDGRGFFLRGDGRKGSFAALLDAIRRSRIEGLEPLATVCRDMLAPVEARPTLRLELTNILNRPVKGTLNVRLGGLQVEAPATLAFGPHETKVVEVRVVGGAPREDNTYPLSLVFDAGPDGRAVHEEDMHVNLVSRRTIEVDGRLEDWTGALPQIVSVHGRAGPTLTEFAWQPFKQFDQSAKKGLATGYVAYDDRFFYFAAKVADETPDEGTLRFETRDEDEYFYPEVCYVRETAGGRDAENFSVRWTGKVRPAFTETYTFSTLSDDGIRVWVGGKKLIDNWTGHGDTWDSGRIELEAGRLYDIKVEFFQGGGGATLGLYWESKSQPKQVVPTEALFTDGEAARNGLAAEYYHGTNFDRLAQRRVDPKIDFMDWPGKVDSPDFGRPAPQVLKPLRWPEGVRRYSYRKDPVLPAGNAPNFDNVQLAFNVLPPEEKPWYSHPPGTMPGYIGYYDTDYEYALNKVAPKYGGGVEVWRLRYPGMPHKHFYPHGAPASPFDGAVKDARLVVVHQGNTRVVECAIPWREIPGVKKRLDAGQTIKFSFRVNDNSGTGCMELSRRRSVAKRNGSFMVDWVEHWANELEFAFEGAPAGGGR